MAELRLDASQTDAHPWKRSLAQSNPVQHGAAFDTGVASGFGDLKKLQDASKYTKSRFSFRLYRR